MAKPGARTIRRTSALTKDRIVGAAIEILDADESDDGTRLTLRVLMDRLTTGSGAIYHHVANMDALRGLAADEVLRKALGVAEHAAASDALLAAALTIFDSIQEHRWIRAQLLRDSLQPAVVRLWKTIGFQLEGLGLHGPEAATAGSTLTGFILGSVARDVNRSRHPANAEARRTQLESMSKALTQSESDPLVEDIATSLREHDDRQQFQDGVRIILLGIESFSRGGS
jgi:AcrR family transcriptional regulator